MTRKERILRMVQRQADDVSYDEVIRNLLRFRDIEIGLDQAARGEVIDHDDLVRQLEPEWRELESSGQKRRKKAAAPSASGSPKVPRARPRPTKSV